ncbi:EpsG family protein [Photobacterium damselae]|uniref:EpsG family protein n=2 Tax=Photobacterium damselae TaxID=38293 RepID=D0YWM4_PHODD|nr:EpsG family protein [Photobacterium damselae]EEZ40489.1 hypothetical protein VDA_001515 [Photobacterium damselae subsp. damselae CIP 102761]PSW83997.1 hypothetical protein CTN07_14775 [Photobacterium damselae]
MIYYSLAVFWAYIILLAIRLPVSIRALLMIPLVVFSTYRGESGPDTENYIYRFHNLSDYFNSFNISSEPLISCLMYIAKLFDENNVIIFNLLYSILLCTLFIFITKRYSISRPFLLTFGVFLLIDGLTNTLRASMCYFLFVTSVCYENNSYKLRLLAFLSHVSTIILIFFHVFFKKVKIELNINGVIKLSIYIVLFGIGIFFWEYIINIFPRIADKVEAYKTLYTRSLFSGLSDIFVIGSLLLVGSVFNRTTHKEILRDIVVIIILLYILFSFASLSIGMLRVLKIIAICLSLSPMIVLSKRRIPSYIFVIIGGLYILNYLRIIYTSSGYLPYGM